MEGERERGKVDFWSLRDGNLEWSLLDNGGTEVGKAN